MLREGELSVPELWLWYIANGGHPCNEVSFEAALLDSRAWDDFDFKLLEWAIEDALVRRR